jgi:TonB family protein
MGRKYAAAVLLLLHTALYADNFSAMQAYQQQDFAKAGREFALLVPLGNSLAAYNLAVMAYLGQGETKNPLKAHKFALLAKHLGSEDADTLLKKTSTELEASAQQQAAAEAHSLFLSLLPDYQLELRSEGYSQMLNPVHTVAPAYPATLGTAEQNGRVRVKILIDEAGTVQVADVVDAFPAKLFNKVALRAVKQWRYPAYDKKRIHFADFNFRLSPPSKAAYEKVFKSKQLFDYALAGSNQHQAMIAGLLNVLTLGHSARVVIDPKLSGDPGTLPDELFSHPELWTDLSVDGLEGIVRLVTGDKHQVTAVLESSVLPLEEMAKKLTGQTLGTLPAGVFILESQTQHTAIAQQEFRIAPLYDGQFWMMQAAQNGNIAAQRVVAATNIEWEEYRAEQGDAQFQAWLGARLCLAGKIEQGKAWLQKAAAQDSSLAKELLLQF